MWDSRLPQERTSLRTNNNSLSEEDEMLAHYKKLATSLIRQNEIQAVMGIVRKSKR